MEEFSFIFNGGLTTLSLKRFLVYCHRQKVSDILLQGGGKIWVERFGRQIPVTDWSLEQMELERVIDALFSTDVKTGIKQKQIINKALQLKSDGENDIGLERGEVVRFRANFTQVTVYQQEAVMSVTLRVLNSKIPPLESLGLPDDLRHSLIPAAGLGLICGETGSGKSTLQASALQYSGETVQDRKIITVESPIEYILGGPKWIAPEPAQCEVGRDVETFADFISYSALRRSPKVISVGELLERNAFEASLIAGKSGHFSVGTMHVKTCGDAIQRSLLMFPMEQREAIGFDIMNIISYIIIQRLLKSTDGKRIAVREYVIFDSSLRKKLFAVPMKDWGKAIDDLLMEEKRTLVHEAWRHFEQGTIEEQEMIEVAGYMDYLALKEGRYGD